MKIFISGIKKLSQKISENDSEAKNEKKYKDSQFLNRLLILSKLLRQTEKIKIYQSIYILLNKIFVDNKSLILKKAGWIIQPNVVASKIFQCPRGFFRMSQDY